MTAPLDYEGLVAAFEHSLLTQLRGHSAAAPFLESWVPDEDPVRGILNMFEAAEIAGERSIAIHVSRETVPAERLPELSDVATEFGTFTVTAAANDGWLLALDNIGLGQLLRPVAPAYRAALSGRLGRLVCAGRIEAVPSGKRLLAVERDGFTLTVLIESTSGIIADARHNGGDAPLERAVLDHFCETLVGLPVQEASDHAAHRLIARLSSTDAVRPVPGIVLPENADPIFALPRAMARQLLAQWRSLTGYNGRENEFATTPDSAWATQSPPRRAAAVVAALEGGSAEAKLPAGAVRFVAMEPNLLGHEVRVIVTFAEQVAPEEKPALARRAELLLKRTLDPHLELYVEELKDQNAIRRL